MLEKKKTPGGLNRGFMVSIKLKLYFALWIEQGDLFGVVYFPKYSDLYSVRGPIKPALGDL